MLVNVFSEATVEYVTLEFFKNLVDSFNHIHDEGTLNALVSILVVMCPAFEKKIKREDQISGETITKNLALEEFVKNCKFYREKLLYLINRGANYRFDMCLETVSILLTHEESKDYFNINDMNLLLDICLREI